MYSCGTQSELPRKRTEKGISKVVSDGEWKTYVFVFLLSTVGTVARYVVAHRRRTYYVTFLKPLLPAIKLLLWLNHYYL